MIVLDTTVISEIFRPNPEPRVLVWLEALADDVAFTTITLAELLAGVRRLPDGRRKAQSEAAINGAIRPYRDTRSLLAFDETAAAEYAEILVARERAGSVISMADAQIAAVCRVHRAACATRNTKDFVQTGIDLIDPWEVAALVALRAMPGSPPRGRCSETRQPSVKVAGSVRVAASWRIER